MLFAHLRENGGGVHCRIGGLELTLPSLHLQSLLGIIKCQTLVSTAMQMCRLNNKRRGKFFVYAVCGQIRELRPLQKLYQKVNVEIWVLIVVLQNQCWGDAYVFLDGATSRHLHQALTGKWNL